jgi:hypothetical protein
MLLHPLAPGVKCPAWGAGGLMFIRVRKYGDLYQCASGGPCKREVLHYYVRKETKTCGMLSLTSSDRGECGPRVARPRRRRNEDVALFESTYTRPGD